MNRIAIIAFPFISEQKSLDVSTVCLPMLPITSNSYVVDGWIGFESKVLDSQFFF